MIYIMINNYISYNIIIYIYHIYINHYNTYGVPLFNFETNGAPYIHVHNNCII